MSLIQWKQISPELSGSGQLTGSLDLTGSFFLNNVDILTEIQTSGIFRQTGSFYNTSENIGITGSFMVSLNGSTETLDVKVTGSSKFKVNEEGVVVLGKFTSSPTPVSGGIFYSSSNDFYFGT